MNSNSLLAMLPSRPPQATAAGYTRLSYKGDFSKIDLSNSKASGFDWYVQNWFGLAPTDPANVHVASGILTLGNGSNHANLQSAIKNASGGYTGTVFGGGGYFEAAISVTASDSKKANSFPAFWMEAIQHVIGTEQWAGQPSGYVHFGEIDIMELYHAPKATWVGATGYNTAIHDWSGVYVSGSGYPVNICNLGNHWFTPPSQPINWSAFNRYGLLWVPQNGTTPGFVQWYFNDLPGPKMYWAGPPVAPPLPGTSGGSWTPQTPASADVTFSIFDQQQFALTLTTDQAWPMRVRSVNVWQ